MPTPKKIKTVADLDQFIATAKPGDRVIYHTGLLALDRIFSKALDILAKRAMELSDRSYVALVQDRHSEAVSDYIAVRGHDMTDYAAAA